MKPFRSIAFPVAGVLILGMALMMVVSIVLTLAVYLLAGNHDRQRISLDVVSKFLLDGIRYDEGAPIVLEAGGLPAKVIRLAETQSEFWYFVSDGAQTITYGNVPPSARAVIDIVPPQVFAFEFRYVTENGEYSGIRRIDDNNPRVFVASGGVSLSNFETILSALWLIWPQGLYHLLGAILVAAATIAVIATRWAIAVPVRRVVNSAESIDGLPNGRRISDHDTPKELKPMVAAFNTALSRIDNAFEAQRNFLASASHELRTPLTKLRIKLDLVQNPDVREVLVRDTTRLASIVTTSLQLARLSGQGLAFTAMDLTALARAIVADHVPSAMKQGMEIEFRAPEGRVLISGSEPAIRVAIDNLIVNALRHAQGTDVLLVEVLNPGTLRVTDRGPGIPLADRDRMLLPFMRGTGSTCEGTGMGLAIVSQVMSTHGGSVGLGDAVGGGLAASLVFPSPQKGTEAA